jgi:putative CocE/NonD family hydrolase
MGPTTQDLRWWGRTTKDKALSLALMSRIELPSDVAPRYGKALRRELMVPMRDGTRLAADVYLPADPVGHGRDARPGPFPALIVRQPYGKREPFLWLPLQGRYWARRGYALVAQDVRGRWASEGEYEPFFHELDDGYDTVDWVAKQPWCDGTVGVMGESYFGYTTWAMAVGGHPAIKAACPGDTSPDMYASAFRDGALCYNPFGVWALWINGKRFRNYLRADSYHLPIEDLDEACDIPSEPWKLLVGHFPKDEMWRSIDLRPRLDEVQVPVMQWSGWYDNFLGETLHTWRDSSRLRAAQGDQYLVLGATDHMLSLERTGRIGRVKVAGHGHGNDRVCRFFDRHLRGAETEFPSAPVTYFTLGRDEWRTAADWPPPGSTSVELFAAAASAGGNGFAPAAAGRGGLLPAPAAMPATLGYAYDPEHPLDAWVGTDGWALAQHMRDRAPFAERADVLVFDSPPLAADFEVTGPLQVVLYASTSAQDTDFIATLDDLFPDGYAHLVQQGIVRARYRDGGDAPVEPGKVVQYAIDLWHTSYVVKAGHRLRLEISSSEFDRYDRNLNCYEPWGTGTRPRVAQQQVHVGGETPTRLTLSGPAAPRF